MLLLLSLSSSVSLCPDWVLSARPFVPARPLGVIKKIEPRHRHRRKPSPQNFHLAVARPIMALLSTRGKCHYCHSNGANAQCFSTTYLKLSLPHFRFRSCTVPLRCMRRVFCVGGRKCVHGNCFLLTDTGSCTTDELSPLQVVSSC